VKHSDSKPAARISQAADGAEKGNLDADCESWQHISFASPVRSDVKQGSLNRCVHAVTALKCAPIRFLFSKKIL